MAQAHTFSTQPVHAECDVAVIGGGLAGLTAAAFVARRGRKVQIFEQARHPGGRAATNLIEDVAFNLGPHALYARGAAHAALTELQVPFTGNFPRPGRAQVTLGHQAYRLPQGLGSLALSRLLNPAEKLRLARLLSTIKSLDCRQVDRLTVRAWLDANAGRGNLALLLAALVRVSTYVDDVDRLSAGAALEQLRLALEGNVLYLDAGWQSIVEGLRRSAVDHGAVLHTSARVDKVETTPHGVTIHTHTGESVSCRAAVLAIEPEAVCQVLDLPADDSLSQWAKSRFTVPAACLDVALRTLPRPHDRFALGLDRPLYYSVHSAAAKLGPPGVAVVHVMKYLRHAENPPAVQIEAEVEAFLDQLQPGWRDQLVARRWLPKMIVTHALPRAAEGGLSGRPSVWLASKRNVFLAGDWVGSQGLLADAAAASACRAAELALQASTAGDRKTRETFQHADH